MSQVKEQLLKLALRVDPIVKTTGVEFTTSTIGTVDGDRFPKQRLLDCYNEARMALAQAISTQMDGNKKAKAISGQIVRKTDFEFTAGLATKPTGYVEFISLLDSPGRIITILPSSLYAIMKQLDSYTNPLVFEEGAYLRAVSSTNVPNASTYVLRYYGVTDWTLSDLSTNETFNRHWEPALIQLAEAIANEQGGAQLNSLASALVGGGK